MYADVLFWMVGQVDWCMMVGVGITQ